MIGLCCDKTYGAIIKYDDVDDDGDNDGNNYGNNNKRSAPRSVSYGQIFNLTTTPWSRKGVSG